MNRASDSLDALIREIRAFAATDGSWVDQSERDAMAELCARAEALQRERDYAWGEMKNAQAYWRAETSHAEQAEALNVGLVEALADLLTYHDVPGPVGAVLAPLLKAGFAAIAKAGTPDQSACAVSDAAKVVGDKSREVK